MPDIMQALPYFVLADSSISSLIVDRIYPYRLPQTVVLPAIVFQDISLPDVVQAHGERSVLPTKRFQFTIYAGTVAVLEQVRLALKARLDGYKGLMGTGAYTTEVASCLFKGENGNNETEIENLYLKYQDFNIMYKE